MNMRKLTWKEGKVKNRRDQIKEKLLHHLDKHSVETAKKGIDYKTK